MKSKQGPRYVVRYKRQRKGLTDYKTRLKLLKSGKSRFVVRKSANAVRCQIISSSPNGDVVFVTAESFELSKYGYKAHTGNIPAAYLTGYLCGIKAKKKKITDAVFDIGLYRSTKASVLYAALKGVLDAGLNVPHDTKNFPDENRISGVHIAEYAKLLSSKEPEKYKKLFSKITSRGVNPEQMKEHFEQVKKKISGEQ